MITYLMVNLHMYMKRGLLGLGLQVFSYLRRSPIDTLTKLKKEQEDFPNRGSPMGRRYIPKNRSKHVVHRHIIILVTTQSLLLQRRILAIIYRVTMDNRQMKALLVLLPIIIHGQTPLLRLQVCKFLIQPVDMLIMINSEE